MDYVFLTDITGVLGEWLSMEFDEAIPPEVIAFLEDAYALAAKALEG